MSYRMMHNRLAHISMIKQRTNNDIATQINSTSIVSKSANVIKFKNIVHHHMHMAHHIIQHHIRLLKHHHHWQIAKPFTKALGLHLSLDFSYF